MTTASRPPNAVSPPLGTGEAVPAGPGLVELVLHGAGTVGREQQELVLLREEAGGAGASRSTRASIVERARNLVKASRPFSERMGSDTRSESAMCRSDAEQEDPRRTRQRCYSIRAAAGSATRRQSGCGSDRRPSRADRRRGAETGSANSPPGPWVCTAVLVMCRHSRRTRRQASRNESPRARHRQLPVGQRRPGAGAGGRGIASRLLRVTPGRPRPVVDSGGSALAGANGIHGRRPCVGTPHAPPRGRVRRTAPADPRARGAVGQRTTRRVRWDSTSSGRRAHREPAGGEERATAQE